MSKRIDVLIEKLEKMRSESVGYYLDELEKFTPNDGNPRATVRAGIIHDLDRHITNLMLEKKRNEMINAQQSVYDQKIETITIGG